jgi:hypothetical protein
VKLNWLKNLPENLIREKLQGDMSEVYQLVGTEIFIELMKAFQKSTVYFSTAALDILAAEYIRLHPELSTRDCQRILGKSDSFVYEARKNTIPTDQTNLFDNVSH